ncbi:hypothetical protein C2G38_2037078 [Gigaspora rosea]|uniref:Uncharacterized protein n=1 Tax=Gigaspora rosea TaxID=44941 RepID=A0A397VFW9_9GLOM|nr:hypothetical protein C2G38_2037078 [Gigaspora rosea]
MPAIGINSVIVGVTTQTVKEIEGNLILEFHVDKRIGDKEASNFTVEAKHSSNNKYLSNKTTLINQNTRVTTVVLAVPWLSQTTIPGYSQRTNRQPRGATPRPLKNKKALLSNMNATSTQQNLSAALGKNLIPNMTNEQPAQD